MMPLSARAHGDLHERIANVTSEIGHNPTNARLFLVRGELQREHEDWPAAEADFARAEKLDPQLAAADLCRARLLTDSGKLAAARAKFDQYLVRCPKDGPALVARARLLVRLGERNLAAADFTRALALIGEPQPEFFLERAQAQVADGQVDAALRGLDEGMKVLGPIVTLQLYAIDLELGLKHFDAALGRLQTVIEQSPRKENWLVRRAEIQVAAGKLAEARESYQSALAAIEELPARLQNSDAMMQLSGRVNGALNGLTNSAARTE